MYGIYVGQSVWGCATHVMETELLLW